MSVLGFGGMRRERQYEAEHTKRNINRMEPFQGVYTAWKALYIFEFCLSLRTRHSSTLPCAGLAISSVPSVQRVEVRNLRTGEEDSAVYTCIFCVLISLVRYFARYSSSSSLFVLLPFCVLSCCCLRHPRAVGVHLAAMGDEVDYDELLADAEQEEHMYDDFMDDMEAEMAMEAEVNQHMSTNHIWLRRCGVDISLMARRSMSISCCCEH